MGIWVSSSSETISCSRSAPPARSWLVCSSAVWDRSVSSIDSAPSSGGWSSRTTASSDASVFWIPSIRSGLFICSCCEILLSSFAPCSGSVFPSEFWSVCSCLWTEICGCNLPSPRTKLLMTPCLHHYRVIFCQSAFVDAVSGCPGRASAPLSTQYASSWSHRTPARLSPVYASQQCSRFYCRVSVKLYTR